MKRRVLIAGVSTRAVAESAARAGYQVTAIDAFGDLDQHPHVRALSLPRDFRVGFSPRAAARVARDVACDAVSYHSSFENHPTAVKVLSAGRALWGNGSGVLRRVRDPVLLARSLERRALATPAMCDRHSMPDDNESRRWLLKARASGGGYGVRDWRPGTLLPRGYYLQEWIDGTPGSVVFVADGRRAVLLGVSRQIVGDAAFGATGWQFCGNILAGTSDTQFGHDEAVVHSAARIAAAVTDAFHLVGVNGVDFISNHGVPHAIEVNPRYTASMELVERRNGLSVFGVHAKACDAGVLPDFDLAGAQQVGGAWGKSIVFARHDVRVGDTRAWLEDPNVRDVPVPRERIRAGRPVCTVFAEGRDSESCYAALVSKADWVYGQLDARGRAVA